MDKSSEAILRLQPVTFRYKQQFDSAKTPQFGLVAAQVEKVDRDLVEYDALGKPYTVRYEAVNAMLLNEFLKEHRRIEEQSVMIAELKQSIQTLTASLKQQAAQIQKVSTQIAVNKPTPRLVSDTLQ
jgi:DNA repair ATPase RecN